MQSAVTGQAPITLERKTTSGGKRIKTEDNTHNWNKCTRYTVPQTKIKRWDQRAYIKIHIRYILVHHASMLNESQQKPKPRRQHSTYKKKTGWNKLCPNRNRKREGREETKISQHQQRKKEDSMQGEYADFRLVRSAVEYCRVTYWWHLWNYWFLYAC